MLWLKQTIAFITGLVIGFAFEFGLLWLINELFDTYLTPRGGLGWIVFPIICGTAFVRIFSDPKVLLELLNVFLELFIAKFRSFSKTKRVFLAGLGLWGLAVLSYIVTFRPWLANLSFEMSLYLYTFSGYLYWIQVAKIIFFPVAFATLTYWVYTRLVK